MENRSQHGSVSKEEVREMKKRVYLPIDQKFGIQGGDQLYVDLKGKKPKIQLRLIDGAIFTWFLQQSEVGEILKKKFIHVEDRGEL